MTTTTVRTLFPSFLLVAIGLCSAPSLATAQPYAYVLGARDWTRRRRTEAHPGPHRDRYSQEQEGRHCAVRAWVFLSISECPDHFRRWVMCGLHSRQLPRQHRLGRGHIDQHRDQDTDHPSFFTESRSQSGRNAPLRRRRLYFGSWLCHSSHRNRHERDGGRHSSQCGNGKRRPDNLPGRLAGLRGEMKEPLFTFTAPTGTFYVRIHAVGPGGRSPASNEIRIVVNAASPPSAPADLWESSTVRSSR